MVTQVIAIYSWPLFVILFFNFMRPAMALSLSIIGAYLLLPYKYSLDLPVVPSVDKNSIAVVSALIFSILLVQPEKGGRKYLPGIIPKSKLFIGLYLLMIVGSFGTTLTNFDELQYGYTRLPAMGLYDSFSGIKIFTVSLIPFLLARKYLAYHEAQVKLLIALAVCLSLYCLPALFEVRFSPQLSRYVYGFFPHAFVQHIRGDGFRPVVFLQHGLWLSILFTTALIASVTMYRHKIEPTSRWLILSVLIFFTLVMSKSLGALMIGIALSSIVLFAPTKYQIYFAALISGFVLLFPMLRSADKVPIDSVISMVSNINHSRANSLKFRIDNEDIVLAKVEDRPIFGWGGWGRSRVYDEFGNDIVVTDGRWIITMSSYGWVGYIAEFGILCIPIIMLALRSRRYKISGVTAGLALVLSANLIDLIPNATLTPVTWLLAGAIAGRLELGKISENEKDRTVHNSGEELKKAREIRYTRQSNQHRRT